MGSRAASAHGPFHCGVGPVIPPQGALAVRRVQAALLAASISHPPGSADTVSGPEIECKIKMQQINGCKSHLEPNNRNHLQILQPGESRGG